MRKTLIAAMFAAVAVAGTAGTASASGAGAVGGATDSPGILSGNTIQIPLNIPVNACGNGLGLLAVLTSSAGNVCANS